MYRVLIADDEQKIRDSIADFFVSKGLSVLTAANGQEAVEICGAEQIDMAILDVRMPVMDGITACREIRRFSKMPILFLSAFGEEQDFLKAYHGGADDYIVKPFPLSVLYEKCVAMIKRCYGISDSKITVGDITIDTQRMKVITPERTIALSRTDYELLHYLCINRGIVLNRELILTRIWGYDFDGDERVVDTHIKRIRKELGKYAGQIKTKSGIGYYIEEV